MQANTVNALRNYSQYTENDTTSHGSVDEQKQKKRKRKENQELVAVILWQEMVGTLLAFNEEVLKPLAQLCVMCQVMRPQLQMRFHDPVRYMLIKTCHFVHITARKKKGKGKKILVSSAHAIL